MTIRIHLKHPVVYKLVSTKIFDVKANLSFKDFSEQFNANSILLVEENLSIPYHNVAAFERIEG